MIVLVCDMKGCNHTSKSTKVYGMSEKFKEKYKLKNLDHLCNNCLEVLSEVVKEYKIDLGVLHLVDEDVYEEHVTYQAVDQ